MKNMKNYANKEALKVNTIRMLAWSRADDAHSGFSTGYEGEIYWWATDPTEDYFKRCNRLSEIFEVPVNQVLSRTHRILVRTLSLRFALEEANEEGEGREFPNTIMVSQPCRWRVDKNGKDIPIYLPDIVDPMVKHALKWAISPRWNAGEEAHRLCQLYYPEMDKMDELDVWRIAPVKEELERLRKEVE